MNARAAAAKSRKPLRKQALLALSVAAAACLCVPSADAAAAHTFTDASSVAVSSTQLVSSQLAANGLSEAGSLYWGRLSSLLGVGERVDNSTGRSNIQARRGGGRGRGSRSRSSRRRSSYRSGYRTPLPLLPSPPRIPKLKLDHD